MRLLRLANSYDNDPNIAAGENKVGLCDRLIAEAAGEPVETTSRVIWPDPPLPDLVEGWMRRYEPDLVYLVVSSYWFTHRSAPLRLQRSLGPFGRPLGKASRRIAAKPWIAHNAPFRALRKAALGAVGGTTFFTPEQVLERMEASIRKILAHEGGAALAVRGPRIPFAPEGSQRAKRWAEARRQLVHNEMKALCERLHVPYQGWDTAIAAQDRAAEFQGDLVHASAAEHERLAREEADLLLEAWRRHRLAGAV